MTARATLLALLLLLGSSRLTPAAVKIVASTSDLADITRAVGGDRVSVDVIVRGDQNPHFVEVKPSYMMKLRSADLFIMVGMELELWAPQIIEGARNSSLVVVDVSRNVPKLEIPVKLDRIEGDIHRLGNPHYWLDPRNVQPMVETILEALVGASPGDEQYFRSRAAGYLTGLREKITRWEAIMKPVAGSRIVTFHRTWSYFATWLHLTVADQVEPKPGIQPSPSHTADLIALIRQAHIKVIIVEPYYDTGAAEQIAAATGARVLRLPTSVGGVEGAGDYLSLMEYNVTTLASALR